MSFLDKSINDVHFVCFDLETTGLQYATDKIIEIGAVKCSTTEELDSFQTFVDIGEDIPQEATAVNGITNAMIKGAPSIKEGLERFLSMLDNSVLVAHNIGFDFRFLNAELARNNFQTLEGIPLIDTLVLARKVLPQLSKHSLDSVASHYDISMGDHHRALDDAKTCKEILFKCCDSLSILGELSLAEVLI